ncbi:MAG TPA: lysylphosphatidylglycerol synthase domain-containing protein [Solirubrobacteraceae bacterium]|nr:lysylphosphatidylglycerol synthase domain-containing protein [Solirubrobacteraceae bacterium]
MGFSLRQILVRLVVLGVFIGAVAGAISSLPGLGTLRHRFSHAEALLILLVATLKLVSSLSHVLAFRDVFAPGMSWAFSYDVAMAEQATNVLVPTGGAGGLAVGAWALRDQGMSAEQVGRRSVAFFVLTSIPNFACIALVGPLLLAGVGGAAPAVLTAIFTGLAWAGLLITALLPLGLRRIDPSRAQGHLRARVRAWAVTLGDGIAEVRALLLPRCHWRALVGAVGWLAFDIASLYAAYAAFGASLPIGPLVFAYTIGQLGGLIPLPGGVGGTDGGLIGALVLFGSPLSNAAAAVLLYRAFQLGLPAVLGTISFLRLRRRHGKAEELGGLEDGPLAAAPQPEGATR